MGICGKNLIDFPFLVQNLNSSRYDISNFFYLSIFSVKTFHVNGIILENCSGSPPRTNINCSSSKFGLVTKYCEYAVEEIL